MIFNVLGIRAPVRMKCEKNKNVHGFHSEAHLEIFALKYLPLQDWKFCKTTTFK